MDLSFNARAATKDVDAIFKPTKEIRKAAVQLAEELNLPQDWLNDAVKGYLLENPVVKTIILDLSHLLVWVPPADYLLAMKAISARFDSKDAEDFRILCEHLKIKNPEKVFKVIARYYPQNRISPKTTFFVEEIFERKN